MTKQKKDRWWIKIMVFIFLVIAGFIYMFRDVDSSELIMASLCIIFVLFMNFTDKRQSKYRSMESRRYNLRNALGYPNPPLKDSNVSDSLRNYSRTYGSLCHCIESMIHFRDTEKELEMLEEEYKKMKDSKQSLDANT